MLVKTINKTKNMELEKIRENTLRESDYETALYNAYDFIKSKGLESAYKAQLSGLSKDTIELIDYINELTNL